MALKKMEHEFPFGTFRSEKKEDYPVQEFHCSLKLCTGTTQKVVFHLLSNRIFRNFLVNGKPPISPLTMKRRQFLRQVLDPQSRTQSRTGRKSIHLPQKVLENRHMLIV